MNRYEMTDEQWGVLEPLMPPEHSGKPGHPYRSHREVINAILWVLHTGAPWRDLNIPHLPWKTVYSRFRRWRIAGFFQDILNILEAMERHNERIDFTFSAVDGSTVRAHRSASGARRNGRTFDESRSAQGLGVSRGGFTTKIHVLCEGHGLPVTVEVTPGQQHESTVLEPLLDSVSIAGKPGHPRQRFDTVSGDKGYDYPGARRVIEARGGEPLIPHRHRSDGTYPPESEGFDKQKYKQRNIVERFFGKIKECRHIAMRYDKLKESYISFLLIEFINIWIDDILADRA